MKLRREIEVMFEPKSVCHVAAAIIGSAVVGAVASNHGGGSTTVTNTPAPQTAAQQEADQLRLAEMRRQNDIAEALLPNQQALIAQQRQLIQYQMDHSHDLDAYQASQLKLANLQIDNQIRDAAMQEQLRPMQLQFLQNQNALALKQIQSMSDTMDFNNENNKYILEQNRDAAARLAARQKAYSPEEEANAAAEEARRQSRLGAMSEQAAQIQLDALKRNGAPTDEQAAFLNTAYDAAQKTGESDITRYLQQTLRQMDEETAQATGMRATDTPIVRLSERAGEEAARAQGDLATDIAGKRATAMVNAGMGLQQLTTAGAANLQGIINSGTASYDAVLQARANANRNAAFVSPQSVGFATPAAAPAPNLSFMNPGSVGTNPGSFGLNIGVPQGGRTTTTTPFGLAQAGQLASGIGSFMSGYSRMGG